MNTQYTIYTSTMSSYKNRDSSTKKMRPNKFLLLKNEIGGLSFESSLVSIRDEI